MTANWKFGVITVSDRCSAGEATDESGPILIELIKTKLNVGHIEYKIIPDDIEKIKDLLRYYSDVLGLEAIFTTGGTGFAPRDVTPEATRAVIDKEAPQMALAMSLKSFQATKYAAISRAIVGIRKTSLIVNMPGSRKAVSECFEAIESVLVHAIEVCTDKKLAVNAVHLSGCGRDHDDNIKKDVSSGTRHRCSSPPGAERKSAFAMIHVDDALKHIFRVIPTVGKGVVYKSPTAIPPFPASIKDGYAVRASGGAGVKKVLSYVSAGDEIGEKLLADDECFKINTGAAVPANADAIVQIEDTKLVSSNGNVEDVVEILIAPTPGLDIRPIGSDLSVGEELFSSGCPNDVVRAALLASVGVVDEPIKPTIGIISTGDELIEPGKPLRSGKIYDSNTTMLKALLAQFGFECTQVKIVKDHYDELKSNLKEMSQICEFIISTGSVSMGDKDYIKKVLNDLEFTTHFGRVNMKPGKPMTFATNAKIAQKQVNFFGLPGNPVSAFVTFHLFVLPALRHYCGYPLEKCCLSQVEMQLDNHSFVLDSRPEYARAMVTSVNGKLWASITGNQISSRLKSLDGADVLLHLPGATADKKSLTKGTLVTASILRHDFISLKRNA